MKAVTIKELKDELATLSPKELRELCLRLARFKKENKELLTYLLFESGDESLYVSSVMKEMDDQFLLINTKSPYLIKKSLRKILRTIRKYGRYSLRKETEVELMVYFCKRMIKLRPSIGNNQGILKLYIRQIDAIGKKVALLHEDLQYDYGNELKELRDYNLD
jgi:hypothetical protein